MQSNLLDSIRLTTQSLRIMAGILRENGIDPLSMLDRAGVAPALLDDPLAEIASRQELAAQIAFAEATAAIPGLWMRTGLRYRVMSYGHLGLAVLAAADVAEGLEVLSAFQALTFSLMRYAIDSDGGDVLALTAADDKAPPEITEFLQERALGSVTMFLNDLQPPRFPLVRIESRLDRPDGWQDCDRLLGTPVIFRAAETRWIFAPGAGRLTLPMASPLLEETYRGLCAKLLSAATSSDDFERRVLDQLVRSGRGFADAATIATNLGVSERTLHRRLDRVGTSYGDLLERVRRERARDLLMRSTLPVERVAEMLGYAETSSFSRAFKRWEGMPPLKFRNANNPLAR